MLEEESVGGNLIAAVRVKDLFGLYTYALPRDGKFSDAAILYGDNGVGKSTLLRLAFHLLSAGGKHGHRTALYEVQYSRLELDLAGGISLVAARDDPEQPKVLKLEIRKGGKLLALWPFVPRAVREVESSEEWVEVVTLEGERLRMPMSRKVQRTRPTDIPYGEQAYLNVLRQFAPTVFILNADRRLDSDSVADPGDEVELRRMMRFEELKRIGDLLARSRAIALAQALSAAFKWIQSKAVKAANQGSMNVHTVYKNVLDHLAASTPRSAKPKLPSDAADLIARLGTIESKTTDFARYELGSALVTRDFTKVLRGSQSKRDLAIDFIRPYVESLEGRLNAIEPTYRLVDKFVRILNGLLSDKTVTFGLSTGFQIHNSLKAQLDVKQLSSGEQQLLLLFCYVLTARDHASVFMIDEPEISLNVKWQRRLIQSLLDITEGSNIQFLFASHSLELLAQHRSRVVKLESVS